MLLVLSAITIFLLFIILWQFYSHRALKKKLLDIHEDLMRIVEQKTSEKLLLQTDQRILQLFLIQINRLLDYNQSVVADYAKTKLELRKMLSNMSHDLKTPLTVILGYIEKLNVNENMPAEQRKELISLLHKKTNGVILLINQFFDLVKLESGDHFIPLSRLHLNEICRKNVLDFYELLRSKGLQVDISIPDEPLYIMGNEEALNRILNNLISNAIRYGSAGNVFGLTLYSQQDMVQLQVWDKGKGIPEKDQDRVFERLYTLDDARHSAYQGSGLGLSITKRLVEVMKGTIHLQSIPYQKTVFTCTFKKLSY